MQLEEVKSLDPKQLQASLAVGPKSGGTAIRMPIIGPSPLKPRLGGYHKIGWIWMERFRDQAFVDLRSI
jgi:hypothetical protein